jgi:hypothetical protein
MSGWIAVDLDGTLARYDETTNFPAIGPPIPKMVERVKKWLAAGQDVRIFTARVHVSDEPAWTESAASFGHTKESWLNEQYGLIAAWCLEHLGQILTVTCEKDFGMIELWDDRCEQVVPNTGQTVSELLTGRLTKADPSCHACGAPIRLGEPVALFHKDCDPCRLG